MTSDSKQYVCHCEAMRKDPANNNGYAVLASTDDNSRVLRGVLTPFNSIEVNLSDNEQVLPYLQSSLTLSIQAWRKDSVTAIIVDIPISLSCHVSTFAAVGFEFHHASGSSCSMLLWLQLDRESNYPEYPHTSVGLGGFVVNEAGQLLVVKERHVAEHVPRLWKFPGGLLNREESLSSAAVREVREETGVESEFVGIMACRHMSPFRWQCDDIYFVCLLKPSTSHITACEHEIADCKWMELDEFLESSPSDFNKLVVSQYRSGKLISKSETHLQSKRYSLYDLYS